MLSTKELLVNGLSEGIKSIVASGLTDQKKVEDAVNALAQRQADIVDQENQKNQDALKQQTILAELTQGTPFTKNARPMVVYAGLLFIFIVHVATPCLGYLLNKTSAANFSLPAEFWWAWTGVVSAWIIGRSYEKVNLPSKTSKAVTGS